MMGVTRRRIIDSILLEVRDSVGDRVFWDNEWWSLDALCLEISYHLSKAVRSAGGPLMTTFTVATSRPGRRCLMSRCNHWTNPPASVRCGAEAEVLLVHPDGTRADAERIGGQMCRAHAEACAAEYQEKLGETWTVEPLEVRS